MTPADAELARAIAEYQHGRELVEAITRPPEKDEPARFGRRRSSDPRYCAPCGILFADVCDAQKHRRDDH